MLGIKAFVNADQIDEVLIHNQGETEEEGIWEYRIYHPCIPEGTEMFVRHRRSDGWMVLTEKVLHILAPLYQARMEETCFDTLVEKGIRKLLGEVE